MSTRDKYGTLLGNTALLSAGTLGSKLMTFLMVRFYTGILTPSDYGTADFLMQTANLLIPVASMGITNGVFRFALDEPERRKSIFSAGALTLAAGAVLLAGLTPMLRTIPALGGYAVLGAAHGAPGFLRRGRRR